MKLTQKLLDKLDREFDYLVYQPKDFKSTMDKSIRSFQIYELCANEFCFELELLQLSVVSLFFKRYIQGFHRQQTYFMKTFQDQASSLQFRHQSSPSKSLKDEEIEEMLRNSEDKMKPKDLMGNFEKINEKTKQALKKQEKDKEPPPKEVVPTSVKENKLEATNALLRTELTATQSSNDQLSKQNEQLKALVSKMDNEKRLLEDELVKAVKSGIETQKNVMTGSIRKQNKQQPDGMQTLDDFLTNLKKNADDMYQKKQKADMEKSVMTPGSPGFQMDSSVFDEKQILMDKKQREEDQKDLDDEVDFAEMKMMLEKREKTFEKVKESGVTKELKQVLKGIAKKKMSVAKVKSN